MGETIIKIEHVTKEYRLGAIGGGTLKGDLQSLTARIRGKEDPNARLGQEAYAKNQRFLALEDVSFSVEKGERVGIIGHNGAGKSTLLKLLSRVTAPTAGTISYNGRIASMLEVGTGFHPELTGRENIYLNGAILGMTKAEITKKFDDIVRFAEMEKFVDTPVKRYSSGMYVKLAFAVAAHLDSEILVMDEVLAVGDMKFQQKCLGKMDDVSKNEGRTVLYVSHNMNTIRQLCTRCIVLDHGKVIFDGDVEQAIGIYGGRVGELKTVYELDEVKRDGERSESLKMTKLTVLDREQSRVQKGEPLAFKLECFCNHSIENAKIRFEIYNQSDSIVGTMLSDGAITAKQAEQVSVFAEMQTSHLAPGIYRVVAMIYQSNEYGTQTGIDRVSQAMLFEVYDEQEGSLVWLTRYWGNVHLDDIHVNQVDCYS